MHPVLTDSDLDIIFSAGAWAARDAQYQERMLQEYKARQQARAQSRQPSEALRKAAYRRAQRIKPDSGKILPRLTSDELMALVRGHHTARARYLLPGRLEEVVYSVLCHKPCVFGHGAPSRCFLSAYGAEQALQRHVEKLSTFHVILYEGITLNLDTQRDRLWADYQASLGDLHPSEFGQDMREVVGSLRAIRLRLLSEGLELVEEV